MKERAAVLVSIHKLLLAHPLVHLSLDSLLLLLLLLLPAKTKSFAPLREPAVMLLAESLALPGGARADLRAKRNLHHYNGSSNEQYNRNLHKQNEYRVVWHKRRTEEEANIARNATADVVHPSSLLLSTEAV